MTPSKKYDNKFVCEQFETVQFDKITEEQAKLIGKSLADFNDVVEESEKIKSVLISDYTTLVNASIIYLWLIMLTNERYVVLGLGVLLVINVILSKLRSHFATKKVARAAQHVERMNESIKLSRNDDKCG